MKLYIKFVAVLLFAVATLLAQQPSPFDNQMPETWKPDLSNSHVRQSVNLHQTQLQYTPAAFSKGRQYDVINIKTKANTSYNSFTLQNNSNNGYYRLYDINHNTTQKVIYNAPKQLEHITINAAEYTPFDDVVATNDMMYALNRTDRPNDPSVTTTGTIDNATLPLLLLIGAYLVLKMIK